MIPLDTIMPREVVKSTSRPDMDPEQAGLVFDIAREAERVLGNRKIDRADFSEPQSQAGVKTDYTYRNNEGRKSSSLILRTDIPDQMTITYNAAENVASLEYQEKTFGTFLQTALVKDQSGEFAILNHYTNDPASLTGILKRAKHGLEYADKELAGRGHQGK